MAIFFKCVVLRAFEIGRGYKVGPLQLPPRRAVQSEVGCLDPLGSTTDALDIKFLAGTNF